MRGAAVTLARNLGHDVQRIGGDRAAILDALEEMGAKRVLRGGKDVDLRLTVAKKAEEASAGGESGEPAASEGKLGLSVQDLTPDLAKQLGLENVEGALVADVEENLGPIDLLVNNAGIIQVGPSEAVTLEDYRHALDVMFYGPLHAAEAVLPGMRARRRGTVVNVTSIGAGVGIPHLAPYTAAKFAARGWSETMGAEAARYGVHVITVMPGLMRTGSFGRALVKGKRHVEASLFALIASLPLLTVSAERAARRIVRAAELGERFVVIGAPARLLRLAHALAPGLVVRTFGVVNRLLPAASPQAKEGMALPAELYRRGLARSILMALGERAARRYNEEPA